MRTFAHFFIIATFLLTVVHPAEAAALSLAERSALIQEVQRLTAQVIALQAQLAQLKASQPNAAASRTTTGELYQSRFYTGAYEAIYQVSGTRLTPRRGSIRAGDAAVFNSYRALVGDDFVKAHITEFRIFNDRDNFMSGFVEQKNDATWLLVVNRFDNDLVKESTDEFMIELLLHESAHIVFFLDDRYQKAFTKQFWTSTTMQNHLSRLERRSVLESKASIGATFYDSHPTWFVSDYAPTSPNEDLVETFVAFVTQPKPTASSIANEKVGFFYNYPELVDWRAEIRQKPIVLPLLQ